MGTETKLAARGNTQDKNDIPRILNSVMDEPLALYPFGTFDDDVEKWENGVEDILQRVNFGVLGN